MNKWRHDFLLKLFAGFLATKRRINFAQLSRYWGFHKLIFRNHFSIPFSFEVFNTYWVQLSGSGEYVTTPSHIHKSGKLTFGKGEFWLGCHKAVKEGLEIAGFALVDMKINTAFHWRCFQTPDNSTLQEKKLSLMQQSNCGKIMPLNY